MRVTFKAGVGNIPDCARYDSGLEEISEHTLFHCKHFRVILDYVGGGDGFHQS